MVDVFVGVDLLFVFDDNGVIGYFDYCCVIEVVFVVVLIFGIFVLVWVLF